MEFSRPEIIHALEIPEDIIITIDFAKNLMAA